MPRMQPFHRAYGGDAFQRQGVCRDVGGDAVALGDGDDAADAVLYPHDPRGRAAFVVALQFVGHVDKAAGVYDVVRGVEYATLGETLAVPRLAEYVVGAPRDDAAAQLRYGRVVEDGAEGAGGEDVARDGQDLIRLHRLGAELLDHAFQSRLVHIGHDQVSTSLVQKTAQVVADVSGALHGNDPALQGGRTVDFLDAGPHTLQDSEGGEWRGVARAAAGDVDPDDVRGLDPDEIGVLRRSTDVLCHDVASAKGLDVAPERAEERLGLVYVGVPDDYRLPAPEVEAARGGLVGHPSRQAQDVHYGFVLAGVRVH